MATFRRRRVGFLLLVAVLLGLYTYSSHNFQPSPNRKTAAIDNYALGNWQPRSTGPIKSNEDLLAVYPDSWWAENSCPGGLDRLYRIASWEWAGADGSVVPFDARGFVVDVLRREGGILLVGDSITWRHYLAVNLLVKGFSGRYQSQEPFTREEEKETLNAQTLRKVVMINPAHPAVEGLLEEAGVGKERLDRPFMSFLRNDYLGATKEVIDQACEEHGVEFTWESQHFALDWLSITKNLTTKRSPHKTLLLLNTGLHFGLSPFTSRHKEDELMYAVLNSIVQSTYKSISEIPNVQAVIRTSYPGEKHCDRTEPFTDMSQADLANWGWHRVPVFNTILKDNFPLLEPARGTDSARPLLLDIERQGTLRSDARERPGSDCLHMCPTAISEDWTRWMAMVMRGEEGAGWGA